MQSLPTVLLKPGEADRIVAGHPWVYNSSVQRLTQPARDGSIVQVKDHRQRMLGVGFYNSRSRINVRMLSAERVTVDEKFLEQRIREALALRARFLPGTTSFRAVNSEGDFLSGLIVDKYEDVLAMQTSSLGMDARKPELFRILQRVFSPRAIVERNDVASRKFEGLADAHGVVAGSLDGPVAVNLNGIKFETDLMAGQKTGLYLDQQANYRRVAELVRPGMHVLDCFSFLGGFALHAARAGASRVLGLDQSADATIAAGRNATANGHAATCRFETANVFDWLKANTQAKPGEKPAHQYEFIVLDPPSFTRNRASVPDAMRGYKEIHLRALRLLKPGGTLATFCCSHHVDARLFLDGILSAAYDARCLLRRVATYEQSADHPVIPSIPETEYLKGFAFELVR